METFIPESVKENTYLVTLDRLHHTNATTTKFFRVSAATPEQAAEAATALALNERTEGDQFEVKVVNVTVQ